MKFYNYLFMRLYKLVSSIVKRNADESTLLYFIIFIFLYTFPGILIIIDRLFGQTQFEVWAVAAIVYTFGLYKLNKHWFFTKGILDQTVNRYGTETSVSTLLGTATLVALAIAGFVVFFFLISLN